MSLSNALPEDQSVQASQLSPIGRFESILLATDGSEYSVGAERVALGFCAQHGTKLHVLSAMAKPGESGFMGPSASAEQQQKTTENLERIATLASEQGIECETHLMSGDDPYEVIVKAANQLVVDMVVMGRRGRRGLARIMLGDATAKVIGHAPCAVLVVPGESQMWSSILVATDGSRYSDMAAVTAGELAKTGNVPLTVLSVKVPIHSERRQAEAQPIVDRVLDFLKDSGVQARGLVEEGAADDTIVEVAADRQAGLIVLGNFGRTGIGRVLFGSKDERVINQTTVPVLITRGGG
ncbi:universal stress protein [Magnetospira sp. QH-2]|uniref:universal stress protein n=1 Tax=Magnetospira sp. (strain QH-2) TaxID=1288970 RepID=UPI0003E80D54|nr:universal stress protein [Magnetospira sp. QH-2]CCQ75216.1 putative universal stress protein [Magnetospira sp. QH-2]